MGQFRTRIESLLAVEPASKPRIYLQIFSLNYILELLFSAVIATFGRRGKARSTKK